MKTTRSQRNRRWGAWLMLVALTGVPLHARSRARAHHGDAWARERFAAAEHMREALNGRPQGDRTRRDYQRVINAYRNIYYGAPTSTKADPSVVAVAETMVEMGRRFDDDKILNQAIAEYKFLRREYPGSRFRCDALFTMGEIYKDDLNNAEQARGVFEEFLHRYPQNRLADDARREIADLNHETERLKKVEARRGKQDNGRANQKDKKELGATKESADPNAESSDGEDDSSEFASDSKADLKSNDKQDRRTLPAAESSDARSGRTARVTGIRHWSTPDYTRVAIDLENEIKFGSQRISNPNRIYFDLRGTKLASTLIGKSFDVDDGFLKKIRVAQFEPGRTRVVLEVANLSDYEAFLLPNPYRLIIDIHGKNNRKNMHAKLLKDSAAMADVEAPPTTSSKPAGANTDDMTPEEALKAAEAKMKGDLRDQAGKAPVTSQDVGDETNVGGKTNANLRQPQGVNATANAGKTPPVTKVVVDADDDDDLANAKSQIRRKSSTRLAAGRGRTSKDRDSEELDPREAKPTANGDRSLIRALGLKIGKIVIDPGHGGHDTGTIGPEGLREKDLVLEVGRRLGKLLETRMGAEVVYTRKNDTFIPLETRTAIANQQRADLFVSIHANSSRDPDARGVETYYLNFTSSPEALEVAARENAVSEKSIYELQDLVKKIAMKEKIEESREFAGDVQESLHSGLAAKSPGIRDRGVKKAPFIVLIGANMPSILAEISFVSNPNDEHRLETSEYRQRIAESLYRGIAKYVDGLSGVRVASKLDKAAGQ